MTLGRIVVVQRLHHLWVCRPVFCERDPILRPFSALGHLPRQLAADSMRDLMGQTNPTVLRLYRRFRGLLVAWQVPMDGR